MLAGGLITKNVIKAFKEYIELGGKKTSQIVKDSGVTRDVAKKDIKSELRRNLGSKRSMARVIRDSMRNKSLTQMQRELKQKRQKKVRDLTRDINKLK